MKFIVIHKGIKTKNLTSGDVRKMLRGGEWSVRDSKELIRHAIHSFFANHRTYEVQGIPYVAVMKSSISAKVMEAHKNRIEEKERKRVEAEERAHAYDLLLAKGSKEAREKKKQEERSSI